MTASGQSAAMKAVKYFPPPSGTPQPPFGCGSHPKVTRPARPQPNQSINPAAKAAPTHLAPMCGA